MNWGEGGRWGGWVPACAGMTGNGHRNDGELEFGVCVNEGLAAWVGELEDGGDAAGGLREPAYLIQRQRAP